MKAAGDDCVLWMGVKVTLVFERVTGAAVPNEEDCMIVLKWPTWEFRKLAVVLVSATGRWWTTGEITVISLAVHGLYLVGAELQFLDAVSWTVAFEVSEMVETGVVREETGVETTPFSAVLDPT